MCLKVRIGDSSPTCLLPFKSLPLITGAIPPHSSALSHDLIISFTTYLRSFLRIHAPELCPQFGSDPRAEFNPMKGFALVHRSFAIPQSRNPAFSAGGQLFAFGDNRNGQLGMNDTAVRMTPQLVARPLRPRSPTFVPRRRRFGGLGAASPFSTLVTAAAGGESHSAFLAGVRLRSRFIFPPGCTPLFRMPTQPRPWVLRSIVTCLGLIEGVHTRHKVERESRTGTVIPRVLHPVCTTCPSTTHRQSTLAVTPAASLSTRVGKGIPRPPPPLPFSPSSLHWQGASSSRSGTTCTGSWASATTRSASSPRTSRARPSASTGGPWPPSPSAASPPSPGSVRRAGQPPDAGPPRPLGCFGVVGVTRAAGRRPSLW